jgi:hypothetical protein
MRTVQLDSTVDCVFAHDAVMCMHNITDVQTVMRNAFAHCETGGVAIFAPDCIRETFIADTGHGGSDSEDSNLRYLEWFWDPDPAGCTFTDYIVVMRERGAGREITP